MSEDIRIKNDKFSFHYRVAGLIEQNGKFLIQKIDGYDYYILPGGHVKLGESSRAAIRREILEEVGCNIQLSKLFCVHENFYMKDGVLEHFIENYFLINPEGELNNNNWSVKKMMMVGFLIIIFIGLALMKLKILI